jgi:hypothetical protein
MSSWTILLIPHSLFQRFIATSVCFKSPIPLLLRVATSAARHISGDYARDFFEFAGVYSTGWKLWKVF